MPHQKPDYRSLRFSNIHTPEYSHLKLLLGWVGYFILYVLTEKLIPAENCHVIHCALDDIIPFQESFAIFYVGWYILILGSLLYFLFYNVHSFKNLQIYMILTQLQSVILYIVYPSRQELRPQIFPRENVLTKLMGVIYRIDTPTGVFPSLHVAISLAIASVWLREKTVRWWIRIGISLFCLGVCLSVVFVKQHSVLDILGAIAVCLPAEWFVFFRNRPE